MPVTEPGEAHTTAGCRATVRLDQSAAEGCVLVKLEKGKEE